MLSQWIAAISLIGLIATNLPADMTPYEQVMTAAEDRISDQETPSPEDTQDHENPKILTNEDPGLLNPAPFIPEKEIAQGFHEVIGPEANFDNHFEAEGMVPFKVKGILVVNKEYHLPEGYHPTPYQGQGTSMSLLPAAQGAFEEMQAAAGGQGVYFHIISGFRSAQVQENLFWSYAASVGPQRAATFSARGGQSEHQTGLAMDVAATGDGATVLQPSFGGTPAGQWLANHAWEYGFILRYPQGKEAITGYQYEPWHFRYVGKEVAGLMKETPGLTLEEYLGLVQTQAPEADPQGPAQVFFRGKIFDRTDHIFHFPDDLAPSPDGNLPSAIGDRLYLTQEELDKAQTRRIPFVVRDQGLLVPYEDGWRLYMQRGFSLETEADQTLPESPPSSPTP